MAQRQAPGQNQTYGLPQPLQNAALQPINAKRAPTALDTGYSIGQTWIWPLNGDWILNDVSGGVATWTAIGATPGAVYTVNGLSPVAGDILIAGTAQQIAVANAGHTVTLSIPAVASNATSFTSGSFITSTAATATTLSSNTLSATGSNASININLTPKGTGSVIQSRALVGNDVIIEANNTDNTNGVSGAVLAAVVGGAAGGDPKTEYVVPGGSSFATGVDNSANLFTISNGTALGTTNVMTSTPAGDVNFPLQPAFFLYLAATATDVTGNGAVYTLGTAALTKLFDVGTHATTAGVFTAPVTGIYDLRAQLVLTKTTQTGVITLSIVTTSKTYSSVITRAASGDDQLISISTFANMSATDTAHVTITATGEVGDTDDVFGSATPTTYFTGTLSS